MPVNNVFIIMPFTEQKVVIGGTARTYTKTHLDDVYTILKEAVIEFRGDIMVDRMEQPYGNLVAAIIERLSSADVVIAVLSGKNPNVFYELGVRHSLRLNTVMLVEEWDEYPFDLSSYFSQRFAIDNVAARNELKAFIKSRLKVLDCQSLPDSPVLDFLQRSEIEQLKVINTWETRRAALLMEGISRELVGVFGVIHRAMEDVSGLKSGKKCRTIVLSWDVIDGFTKTRPIPGLPAAAYGDSEQVYRSWRNFQRMWNGVLESGKKPDADVLVQIIAFADRQTVAYAFDLATAWEYVMTNRVAYGIPWSNSLSAIDQTIPDTGILQTLRVKVGEILVRQVERFKRFDHDFLGVPDSILAASRATEVRASQDIKALAEPIPTQHAPIVGLLAKNSPSPRKGGKGSPSRKPTSASKKPPHKQRGSR